MDSDETLFDDSQVCNREHYTISYSDTDYCLKEEKKDEKMVQGWNIVICVRLGLNLISEVLVIRDHIASKLFGCNQNFLNVADSVPPAP